MANINGSRGAFGELIHAELTPQIQVKFPYLVNPRKLTTTTANGGTATIADSMMNIQTSTAVNGACTVVSKDVINYHAGQGVRIRFTAAFTLGRASSSQEVGYGDATDGFFFGYSGATFGVIRRTNGNDTFTAITAWSEYNTLQSKQSDFDPTYLNVYEIIIQWLGAGMIYFPLRKKVDL